MSLIFPLSLYLFTGVPLVYRTFLILNLSQNKISDTTELAVKPVCMKLLSMSRRVSAWSFPCAHCFSIFDK